MPLGEYLLKHGPVFPEPKVVALLAGKEVAAAPAAISKGADIVTAKATLSDDRGALSFDELVIVTALDEVDRVHVGLNTLARGLSVVVEPSAAIL